jgi:hypothetical protein
LPAINSYLTDIIRIIRIDTDKWGKITKTESSNIKCRVEDMNKLVTDSTGQEVYGEMEILFDYAETVEYADKIKIIKKNGINYQQPDKEWLIKKISQVAMFKAQYKYLVV